MRRAMREEYDKFIKEGSLIIMEGTVLSMMDVYDDLEKRFIEAVEYAIGYLKGKQKTNREKIFEVFGVILEPDCICTSDECEEECIKNGDCFACEKWLNAEFRERSKG